MASIGLQGGSAEVVCGKLELEAISAGALVAPRNAGALHEHIKREPRVEVGRCKVLNAVDAAEIAWLIQQLQVSSWDLKQ
eukprot:CAMPEP_0117651834 /NCGR_PEP_ID=MMETSP0804-20121206/2303_1 /TAXON_ID=1074897 /ORGANISM="Tetraselmis astigmatica, Strain CCMP880" /LENGTH=79 /DNA_ID=CAMNT_0005457837 /DNA_START=834 /DNA_END=1074 /DNA_ORIENTATION=+